MKSWTRITIAVFVLIGGAVFFRYWSIHQFDSALSNLSSSYVASVLLAPPLSQINNKETSTTSPETLTEIATSTDSELADTIATSTKPDTKPELSFIFPQKNSEVYVGCTYKISWSSSLKISSLETALIDGGTRETVGPIASGLAKENTIEKDSQNLDWKVGIIWPGSYYIKISKINGIDIGIRSNFFTINKMPEGISTSKRENICKESGGSFATTAN
jgi:hypothetical protein